MSSSSNNKPQPSDSAAMIKSFDSDTISERLRRPDSGSGSGDDELCRWLYEAFQSGDPNLRLTVLCHIPLLAGAYLSRAALNRPLPGFEAVLLALYADAEASRAGEPITVSIPNGSESSTTSIISHALEPCGTVRSTRRAMIVGVALELYYNNVHSMPNESKLDFCHVCKSWAGGGSDGGDGVGCIPLPWEVMQPILRILGHFVVGYWANDEVVCEAAREACESLHVRAIRDVDSKAILGTEALLRLGNFRFESIEKETVVDRDDDDRIDITEISVD